MPLHKERVKQQWSYFHRSAGAIIRAKGQASKEPDDTMRPSHRVRTLQYSAYVRQ